MDNQQNELVPQLVRSYICIISITAVPILAFAAYNGADIPLGVTAMVGAVAVHTSRKAFQSRL